MLISEVKQKAMDLKMNHSENWKVNQAVDAVEVDTEFRSSARRRMVLRVGFNQSAVL